MRSGLSAWAVLVVAASGSCGAQVRWCLVTGTGAQDTLPYPPIARAANVTGTVIERVTFTPAGNVLGVEVVLGPKLIAEPVSHHLKDWQFHTDATGTQSCQVLVVADFDHGGSSFTIASQTPSSMYRVSVRAKPPVLDTVMYGVSSKH